MADSVHQDVLDCAQSRLAALDLGGMEDRILRRAIMAGAWETGAPAGDFLTVSGYGTLSGLQEASTGCTFDMGYPLVVTAVYRSTKQWSTADEAAQQAVTQAILDAFLGRNLRLPLTYPGASHNWTRFVAGVTMEKLDEAWQQIMRSLTFEIQVRQHSP